MKHPRLVGCLLLLVAAGGLWAFFREANLLAAHQVESYTISEVPEFFFALPLVAGFVLFVLGAKGANLLRFRLNQVTWQQAAVVVGYFIAVVAIHNWRAKGIAALGYKFFFSP